MLLQALLGGDEVGGLLLGGRGDLHPVVLALLHRDAVLGRLRGGIHTHAHPTHAFFQYLLFLPHLLDKLVLQGVKAVEADSCHVAVLHGDGPLGLLVLPQEREVLQGMEVKVEVSEVAGEVNRGRCCAGSVVEGMASPSTIPGSCHQPPHLWRTSGSISRKFKAH